MFVGEKRSPTAIARGWTWKTGHLAAKTLHDALRTLGFDPTQFTYANWYETPRVVARFEGIRIGMGAAAQTGMKKAGVEFVPMVHPAARGKIRKTQLYQEHVSKVMGQVWGTLHNRGLVRPS